MLKSVLLLNLRRRYLLVNVLGLRAVVLYIALSDIISEKMLSILTLRILDINLLLRLLLLRDLLDRLGLNWGNLVGILSDYAG